MREENKKQQGNKKWQEKKPQNKRQAENSGKMEYGKRLESGKQFVNKEQSGNRKQRINKEQPESRKLQENRKKTENGKRQKIDKQHENKEQKEIRKDHVNQEQPVNRNQQETKEQSKTSKQRVNKEQPESRRQQEEKSAVPCKVYKKCGGCRFLDVSYEEHLKHKEKQVKELCGKFGSFEPIMVRSNPSHYRHKVHAVFGEDRRHNIISGTYEEKTHKIVQVDNCLLENQEADRIILTIRKLLKSFKIKPYNEDTGFGLFRHVLIRCGRNTGEILVILVLASPILPSKNNFVKALLKEHPEITTVVLNVNNRGTSMVLGEKDYVIYGKGYIEDTLCGKTFRISPQSFYQVNPEQTEVLYNKAMEYAGLTGKEVVFDAYCGTGTIGLIASEHAKQVIGVEVNKAAVADARLNAKRNAVKNITFYEKDAGQFMVQMAEERTTVDVVFMDPPRSGSDEAFLSSLVKLAPKRVVYVSCNPETLARDLEYLKKHGYGMKKGVAVDMFPWTGHVETVCLLSRKAAN